MCASTHNAHNVHVSQYRETEYILINIINENVTLS